MRFSHTVLSRCDDELIRRYYARDEYRASNGDRYIVTRWRSTDRRRLWLSGGLSQQRGAVHSVILHPSGGVDSSSYLPATGAGKRAKFRSATIAVPIGTWRSIHA